MFSVPPGGESKIPAGVLTVSLELFPPLAETLKADILSTQVRAAPCGKHWLGISYMN